MSDKPETTTADEGKALTADEVKKLKVHDAVTTVAQARAHLQKFGRVPRGWTYDPNGPASGRGEEFRKNG